jgi:hypothetical protein
MMDEDRECCYLRQIDCPKRRCYPMVPVVVGEGSGVAGERVGVKKQWRVESRVGEEDASVQLLGCEKLEPWLR